MIHISNALHNKIKQSMDDNGKVIFDNDELDLYNECEKWFNYIVNIMPVKYKTKDYKLDIGRFYGIYPGAIGCNCIYFMLDYYNSTSWKDWFIVEGVIS